MENKINKEVYLEAENKRVRLNELKDLKPKMTDENWKEYLEILEWNAKHGF